jgi:hypothetical protein
VPSFEQIFDRDEPLHLFIIARHPSRLHQSPMDDPGSKDTLR